MDPYTGPSVIWERGEAIAVNASVIATLPKVLSNCSSRDSLAVAPGPFFPTTTAFDCFFLGLIFALKVNGERFKGTKG